GMTSGNEVPDVALLFPCSILNLLPEILQQNVQLGEQKGDVRSQRNRKFPVFFPVSREFS
ncbi:MAG: hypothetical protein WAL05_02905, partial [Candidatus Sulfotelmatobacter sp.]